MRLVQDLCVFDLVSTGPDPERDQVLQLAAVLLDKDNLLEKAVYNSYLKISLLESNLQKHAALCGVSLDVFRAAPKTGDVAQAFKNNFAGAFTLATSRVQNMFFFKQFFKRGAVVYPYSHDCLDVWTLGFDLAALSGWEKIPSLESLATHVKQPLLRPQNALERARISAGFLRWHWAKYK